MQIIPKVTRDCRLWYALGEPEGIFVPSPHESYGDVIIAVSEDKRSCFVKPVGNSGSEFTGQGCTPEHEIPRFIQWRMKEDYLLALQAGRQETPFYAFIFKMLKEGPVNWGWEEVEKLQKFSPVPPLE